jgi:hypothetical protein
MANATVRSLIEHRELIRRCDRAGINEIVSIARLTEAHVLNMKARIRANPHTPNLWHTTALTGL